MELGGNLIKIIETNLLVNNTQFFSNDIYQKSGGIHAMYSDLTISHSQFDVRNTSILFHIDPDITQLYRSENHYGGYAYIGPNSTLVSKYNQYKNARSNVGGCVTVLGAAWARFYKDSFEKCVGVTGGAIAAIDFKDLTVDKCTFSTQSLQNYDQNVAFSGKGESIFAQRFHGTLSVTNSDFAAAMNAVWVEEGRNLVVDNVEINYKNNLLQPTAFTQQKYGGGFHILNINSIKHFNNVKIKGTKADYGGCMYLGLDHHFKQ